MEISIQRSNKFKLLMYENLELWKPLTFHTSMPVLATSSAPKIPVNTVPGMFKNVENNFEIHRCRKVCQVHGRLLFSNYHNINELAESPQPCTLAVQKVKNEQIESLAV